MAHSDTSPRAVRHFADGVSLPDLVRYLREGVYLMDATGVLLDANPVALDLLGGANVGGAPVRDRSRDAATWRAELDALVTDGAVREFTRQFVHPDDTTRTVLDTCYARTDNGVVTFHGVLVDITVHPPRGAATLDDTHTRDIATGAYAPEYLAALDADRATRPTTPIGLCVVQVDPGAGAGEPTVAHALDVRLERMVRFLLRHVRGNEPVIRLAHDRLAVCLPGADEQGTETVGRRLQLAALRSAPCAFRLGWATQHDDESLVATAERALRQAVPVRVVERGFDPPRHG
jgi:hypothetical protein